MPSTQLAALTHDITAPARQILATLPRKKEAHAAIFGTETGRLSSSSPNHDEIPRTSSPKKIQHVMVQADYTPGRGVEVLSTTRQSVRTYYLGLNGRVSQRKHLVGPVAATVRAFTTDHARFLFTESANQVEDLCYRKPYIGKAV